MKLLKLYMNRSATFHLSSLRTATLRYGSSPKTITAHRIASEGNVFSIADVTYHRTLAISDLNLLRKFRYYGTYQPVVIRFNVVRGHFNRCTLIWSLGELSAG